MSERFHREYVPSSCKKLQEQIEILKWVKGVQRLIPNLPNGSLRDQIDHQIADLVSGSQTREGKLSQIRQQLLAATLSIKQQLDILCKSKKPTPQMISNFNSFAEEIRKSLDEISIPFSDL